MVVVVLLFLRTGLPKVKVGGLWILFIKNKQTKNSNRNNSKNQTFAVPQAQFAFNTKSSQLFMRA